MTIYWRQGHSFSSENLIKFGHQLTEINAFKVTVCHCVIIIAALQYINMYQCFYINQNIHQIVNRSVVYCTLLYTLELIAVLRIIYDSAEAQINLTWLRGP